MEKTADYKQLMQFLEEKSLSKKNALFIANWMGKNKTRIAYCWAIIQQEDEPISRRAAYALDNCAEKDIQQVRHLIPQFIHFLPVTKSNPLKRHISRILTKSPLPKDEELQGLLAEYCFNFLVDAEIDVAIKAHCIDLIFRLCKIYPELEVEFHSVLQDQMEKNRTAFITRARKILSGTYKVKEVAYK